ncbi:putative toxin-antitoxin system toxin component, PIN family [Candidatus Amesbacteria bacterium]|nr:putative toxin-antitoxin system toxin component, PIN family [Candidatus Amesbacteria bacterium]
MKKLKNGSRKTRLFLDSSVLFSAVWSVTGGAAKIISWASENKIIAVVSKNVIAEVESNVGKKMAEIFWPRLETLLLFLEIDRTTTDKQEFEKAKEVIISKDAVILVDAKRCKADVLVTLDKKDMLQLKVRKFMHPIKIMTPGEVIKMLEFNNAQEEINN